MKYYIISGESSGEMHGANLIKALRKLDNSASIRFWGGDKMLQANGNSGIDQHICETAFMGFTEVIANLRTIFSLFKKAKENIISYDPDVVILIDYPGFNMRMAKWLKKQGFKVVYYIVPQVWAWKDKRAYNLDRYSDLILTILPFEQTWFHKRGIEVSYVGHPLLDEINPREKESDNSEKTDIVLLPGSRKQEVGHILKPMLEACRQLTFDTIKIAKVSSLPIDLYEGILCQVDLKGKNVIIEENNTYRLIQDSAVALVGSGTATLETAVIGTPQVVCYIGSPISYAIARRLVKLQYISLVNLIMDAPLVPELIQHDCTVDNIIQSVNNTLNRIGEIRSGYKTLKKKLGGPGASDRAASSILQIISS